MKIFRITTVPVSLHILLHGQLKFMSRDFDVIGISSSGTQLEKVASDEGIQTLPLEMVRDISILKDFKSLWRLFWLIKKEKPIIVHTHTPKAGTLGMIAAWLCLVPVRLHTVAGLPLMETRGLKRSILNMVEKITYACATKVYPNSFGLKEIILDNKFCSLSKLKVIGNGSSNGIDTNHFSLEQISLIEIEKLKTQLGISSQDFVFVFVGRLVKDKGINELVGAFKNIVTKNPKTKLLFVGKTEPRLDPLLPETIQEINMNPNIITVGFQSDVRPYYAVSDALAFPSYREGFPNVPMQAGAMGLPSIVTNINGCNEIIQHGHNGIIIPPKNTRELEKAMLQIIEEPEFTKKMATNARQSIVSRFDQQTLWHLIKDEYNDQLKNAGLK